MKICPECHSVFDDDKKFCENCGAALPAQGSLDKKNTEEGTESPEEILKRRRAQEGTAAGKEETVRSAVPVPPVVRSTERDAGSADSSGAGYTPGDKDPGEEKVIYTDIVPRSIPLAIILTIVTCGFYGLYWLYKLNNEVNEMAEDTQAPDGLLVVVFTIVTCGIYGLYWLYQTGRKCDYISGRDSSSAILYLVLGLFGLSIVSYALIQDTINRALE